MIRAVRKVSITLAVATGSVDIEDFPPVTSHTPVAILFTRDVRAAVADGILLPNKDGAATVTRVLIGDTLRAAF